MISLDDQAGDESTLGDAAKGRLRGGASNALAPRYWRRPRDFPAFGSEGRGVAAFSLRMPNGSATSAGSSHISDKEA